MRSSALTAFFETRLTTTGRPPAGPGVEALLVSRLPVAREDGHDGPDRVPRPTPAPALREHAWGAGPRRVRGRRAHPSAGDAAVPAADGDHGHRAGERGRRARCLLATGTGTDDDANVTCPTHPPAPQRVDPSVHTALRQKLPYMGAHWLRVHGTLSNTAEALHAETRGLATPFRRPAPVAHTEAVLVTAFVLAAVDLRRIDRFLERWPH